jgi:hypothetical protein
MTRSLHLLAACALGAAQIRMLNAQEQQGSTVNGIVVQSWRDAKGGQHQTGFHGKLSMRLCSVERVFETHSDNLGRFTFPNVPPGVYNLSAGRQVSPPRTMTGIEVKAGDARPALTKIDIEDHQIMRMEDADCFRDTTPPMGCTSTWFKIDYGPGGKGDNAQIRGQVADWNSPRSTVRVKAKASISLTKVSDPNVHYSTVSSIGGRFQFAAPPGVYDLTASVPGWQPVKINHFLVPRENTTEITLLTLRKDQVVVCQ